MPFWLRPLTRLNYNSHALNSKLVRRISGHIVLPKIEELYVGTRSANAIDHFVTSHNYARILLVASKTLDTTTNEIQQIETALSSRVKAKFTGIRQHNPCADLFHSICLAREHDVDCIVVVGGGSNTDNGKIAAALKNEETLQTEADIANFQSPGIVESTGFPLPSPLPSNKPVVPVVLVPTTLSGTTKLAGTTDLEKGKKMMIHYDEMMPRAKIFDPLITKYTPEWLWLSTGIRAFDHCIETLMSPYSNTYWNGITANALKTLLKYLPRCTFGQNELNAEQQAVRLECLVGAYMAIQAVGDGCPMGASHAIGYQLGAVYGIPHGYTSCIMTPYVLNYNVTKDSDGKYACKQRAEVIKNVFIEVFGGNPDFDSTKDVATMMHDFIAGLGLPRTLQQCGVENEEQFGYIAKTAINIPWVRANPFPIEEEGQIVDLLQMAFGNQT